MLNTIRSRFGRGSTRWFVMPAVLATFGFAMVSLATGALAFGTITPSPQPNACPVAHSSACGKAAQSRTALKPAGPVITIQGRGQLMPGASVDPAVRARIAALRAQYFAGMQRPAPNGTPTGR